MMEEEKWLIYCHTNRINGKKYIGLTKNAEKRFKGNGYGYYSQKKFYNAIKKYGWNNFNHEILVDNIPTIEEANKLEIYYINLYDSKNNGYNATLGGDGTKGLKHSDEYCKRLSENRKGEKNPMFNKPSKTAKKVAQIDLQGNIVKVYNNLYEPLRDYKTTASSICGCIHYKKKTIQGYIWLNYIEDKDEMQKAINERLELMKKEKEINNKKRSEQLKKVWKDTPNLAERIHNTRVKNGSSIKASKKLRELWNDENYRKRQTESHKGIPSSNRKKIKQYDLKGNFIKEYESIAQAEKELKINGHNISSCCKGKRKTVGNFIWKYS